ncbi:HAD family phosphatase [Georgenia yuyongxinii]|uniref:HAD family phosphatase n=1 Tax=Georgenia yuyongxinii TaxID=2589797 RepID=A0A5B8C4E8_9MICO|nr:HAD family phosphatase [Georgenia yuyongxinii]QDC24185.1 HAD family phosphatase [Georgenia yuyongxinii]
MTRGYDVAGRVSAALAAPGAALLLDLDGTLVDSEATHRAAFHRYFRSRGWQVDDATVRAFAGRRGTEVFAELDGPWAGEDPHQLTLAVLDSLDVTLDPPAPVPGAARAVAGWREAGVPVAVVTSARRSWARDALAMLGVADLGVELVTAEDTAAGKPDPAPYRHAAHLLGADPAACVAAEDTPAGLASALAAGVGLVVGVTTSHPGEVLRAAGAHAAVADLEPLVPPAQRSRR